MRDETNFVLLSSSERTIAPSFLLVKSSNSPGHSGYCYYFSVFHVNYLRKGCNINDFLMTVKE
jgi:hypothetical protein